VGSSGKIAYSVDIGLSWTQATSPFDGSNLFAVSYGDGIYIAAGSAGKLATSVDGLNWTLRDSSFGAGAVLGLSYSSAANLWIAVGASGRLATSLDGVEWVQRTSSFSTTFITSVYSSPSLIIAVGYDGKLATSSNGISWTQRGSSFVLSTIYGVTLNPLGTPYVAVGESGKVAVSSTGETWTQIFPPSSFGASSIRAIASTSNNTYLAAGSAGKIATTRSPEVWAQRVSTFGLESINDVYMEEGVAIAVGNNGKIAYSA
jgi:hypothetical protein